MLHPITYYQRYAGKYPKYILPTSNLLNPTSYILHLSHSDRHKAPPCPGAQSASPYPAPPTQAEEEGEPPQSVNSVERPPSRHFPLLATSDVTVVFAEGAVAPRGGTYNGCITVRAIKFFDETKVEVSWRLRGRFVEVSPRTRVPRRDESMKRRTRTSGRTRHPSPVW